MPRLNIQISEPAYAEVSRAASDHGLSVEDYVADLVETGINDEGEYAALTERQLSIIAQGEADIDAGRFFTMAQTRERLAENRASWLHNHPR